MRAGTLEYATPDPVMPGRDGNAAALGVLLQLVLVPGVHHQQFRADPHGGMQGMQVEGLADVFDPR
jgi:hypothetical protein